MIFKIAWRNIWRNKKRTLITTLSVSAALFLIILMRSMQFGFYDNIIHSIVQSYSGYIQVHSNGYWEKQSLNNAMEIDDDLINKINSVDGVKNLTNRLQTFALVSKGEKSKGAIINGVEIEKEQLAAISEMRDMMQRSSRFLSLSGLAGILVGCVALVGVAIAYSILEMPVSSTNYLFSLEKTRHNLLPYLALYHY